MLIFADPHLGDTKDSILVEGVSSKVLDTFERSKEVIDYAHLKGQSVCIAGDIFDSASPSPDIISFLFQLFAYALSLNVEMYIIPGNHDSSSKLESLVVAKDSNYPNVHIISSPKRKVIDGISFFFMPHIRKVDEAALFSKHQVTCYEDLIKKAKVQDSFVISHAQLLEATYSSEQGMEAGNAICISIKKLPKMKGMVLGHIHKYQVIEHAKFGYPIVYAGSVVPHSFKEGEDSDVGKGYVEISSRVDGIKLHTFKAGQHIYKTINVHCKDDCFFVGKEKIDIYCANSADDLKDKLLKLKICAKRREEINELYIRSAFNKVSHVMRVESILEEEVVEDTIVLGDKNPIQEDLNFGSLLSLYLKSKVKDKDERKRILTLGKSIINESKEDL